MNSRSSHPAKGLTPLRLLAVVTGLLLAATIGFTANAAPTASGPACVNKANCVLAFVNQPNTTQTNATIKSGYDSTGDSIKVEIRDPDTGLPVRTNAQVTLTIVSNPSGGTLTGGGPVSASNGTATFGSLSINKAGIYTLRASSAVASNTPTTSTFMVADSVDKCASVGCTFTESQGKNAYTVDPVTGTDGATYAAALNIANLKISCDFSPYNYPESRQPNGVWFNYEDGSTSSDKIVTIRISKAIVQQTAENGASFYRVCFSSPLRFKDRNGVDAPSDPWTTPDVNGKVGPSTYFGTTWYTGLLPDCGAVSDVAPCVISWTGTSGGDRLGTFRAPAGDPIYR